MARTKKTARKSTGPIKHESKKKNREMAAPSSATTTTPKANGKRKRLASPSPSSDGADRDPLSLHNFTTPSASKKVKLGEDVGAPASSDATIPKPQQAFNQWRDSNVIEISSEDSDESDDDANEVGEPSRADKTDGAMTPLGALEAALQELSDEEGAHDELSAPASTQKASLGSCLKTPPASTGDTPEGSKKKVHFDRSAWFSTSDTSDSESVDDRVAVQFDKQPAPAYATNQYTTHEYIKQGGKAAFKLATKPNKHHERKSELHQPEPENISNNAKSKKQRKAERKAKTSVEDAERAKKSAEQKAKALLENAERAKKAEQKAKASLEKAERAKIKAEQKADASLANAEKEDAERAKKAEQKAKDSLDHAERAKIKAERKAKASLENAQRAKMRAEQKAEASRVNAERAKTKAEQKAKHQAELEKQEKQNAERSARQKAKEGVRAELEMGPLDPSHARSSPPNKADKHLEKQWKSWTTDQRNNHVYRAFRKMTKKKLDVARDLDLIEDGLRRALGYLETQRNSKTYNEQLAAENNDQRDSNIKNHSMRMDPAPNAHGVADENTIGNLQQYADKTTEQTAERKSQPIDTGKAPKKAQDEVAKKAEEGTKEEANKATKKAKKARKAAKRVRKAKKDADKAVRAFQKECEADDMLNRANIKKEPGTEEGVKMKHEQRAKTIIKQEPLDYM